MENICDYKNCCACGLCASICPTNAISLVSDSFGFFYPTIDSNKCIDCRKCSQSCINNATFPNPVSEPESCYSYSTSDQKIIEQCASGGAAHDLYAAIIALGGVAYGIAYSEDYSFAGYCRVTEINQLSSLLGTKYFHARPNIDLYQSIENDLKKGCPVIFIGLPCEVAALRLRFHNSFNLYLVDIFCHGVTSETIHEKK